MKSRAHWAAAVLFVTTPVAAQTEPAPAPAAEPAPAPAAEPAPAPAPAPAPLPPPEPASAAEPAPAPAPVGAPGGPGTPDDDEGPTTADEIEPPRGPPRPRPSSEGRMSEGRMLVAAYNTGFQWGLSPGVVFPPGQTAAFYVGLRFGYGMDTGTAILVPGVQLAAYFTIPNVYLGMPVMKLVYPIDRFAPFVEGGVGLGEVPDPSATGVALMAGGGFMVHPSSAFAFGVQASYQAVTQVGFHGFGLGPILAIGL